MKKIIRSAVNNPVTVLMVILAVVLLGKISFDRLGVDLLPDIDSPKLYIELTAANKPPEEIEKQYVEQIEAAAVRQNNVTSVSSSIRSGSAKITVDYTWSKDMNDAYIDLQKAIDPFSKDQDISELKITQHDANADPIALVALTHADINDMAELRRTAENQIRNELIRVDGVAEVVINGAEYNCLYVKTDPYRMKAFGLDVSSIASKITTSNQVISGGSVTDMGLQYIVKGKTSLSDLQDFENLIVGFISDTGSVRLADVADVTFQNDKPENIVRLNSKRCIGLSIYKERAYNTVKAVNAVKDKLGKVEKSLPGYHLQMISNQGEFIENSVNEVKSTAIIGILLAVLVIFFFLRSVGTTLIVSLTIPISIVATFNLMYFGGLNLNVMTLGGLALGAGMLVDNSIVVIESIFRNRESGLSAKDAAINGTAEVAGAVIASTLTTIVVFLPIVYLHGASGELFKDEALTVTFSLLSSLIVAIFFIPMIYSFIFRKENRISRSTQSSLNSVRFKNYPKLLHKVLNKKWWVIAASFAVIIMTIMIMPLVGTEFMPKVEGRNVTVSVKLAEGTDLERTSNTVASIENQIYELLGDSTQVYSQIGKSTTSSEVLESENTAEIKVAVPKDSKMSLQVFTSTLTSIYEDNENIELNFKQDNNVVSTLFSESSSPVMVEIKGEDLEKLATISKVVKNRMLKISDLENIISSSENGAPEIAVNVKREMAGINNITSSDIVNQLKNFLIGKKSGKFESNGEMKDIVIKLPEMSLSDLSKVPIVTSGKTYLLEELADFDFTFAPKEILRKNQHRIINISANMKKGTSLDKVAKKIEASISNIDLPNNYSISVTGEEALRKKAMSSLMLALLLSIILVYMVLASQFESLLHPFTILLTIPFALCGAVVLFLLLNMNINVMGVIGIIMLAGIAVNDSIILVDRINQIKKDMPLKDAIVEAASQRIRPILMTTLTTILALVPMCINFGESSSLRAPMSVAVIGGLITSTIMSLIIIPCFYLVLETLKMKANKHRNLEDKDVNYDGEDAPKTIDASQN
ncbi:MAG: efflux RND transporter permease subunit [Bacteroidales bacterium]